MTGLAAVGAGAEDLQGVADVGEAVLGGDRPGPALDRRPLDLDRRGRSRGRPGGGGACPSSGGRSPRRPRCAACRPRRPRPAAAGSGRPWPARPSRRAGRAGRGSPGRSGSRRRTPSPRRRRSRCFGRAASAGRSVLVIVLSVGGVPVAVVDVVDVVAVRTATWPQSGPCSCGWSSVGVVVDRRAGRAGNGARSRCRRRSQTPTGQVTTKPASASSTIVGPGRDVGVVRTRTPRARSPPSEASDAEHHRRGQRGAERPGELLGGRHRHHHQRRDQQQPDGAHRDGDADRGEHGDEHVVDADAQAGDPRELLVLGDGEQLGRQPDARPRRRPRRAPS